mgnify:CR=1 FL=1
MEFIMNIVGNKVHIGDEVIYSEYKGGFERAEVVKIHPHSVTISLTRYSRTANKTYKSEKPCVSRFIKVVEEKE